MFLQINILEGRACYVVLGFKYLNILIDWEPQVKIYKIKCRLALVTHQWTFLVNIGYIFHTFLILTNSSFYMNEPWKTDCLQKSFDGNFIWPDKV